MGSRKEEAVRLWSDATSIHDLWARLVDAWKEISTSLCVDLMESMPGRIDAVLKAKGGYTRY
jgi:hypothetical protein